MVITDEQARIIGEAAGREIRAGLSEVFKGFLRDANRYLMTQNDASDFADRIENAISKIEVQS